MRISSLVTTTLLSVCLSTNLFAKDKFSALPFGAIKPEGWIAQQMQNDIDQGFVGQLDKLVPDLIYQDDIYGANRLSKLVKRKNVGTDNSGHEWEVQFLWWNSETQSNWWDGYLRHILLLDDEQYKPKVSSYVANKLATADEDGYMGIYGKDLRYQHTTENGELWAQSSLFRGLLAYYEATDNQEALNAVVKAVDLTMSAYPINNSTPFKAQGAFAGVGHGLTFVDVLNTLYRITGKSAYLDYAVFLYDDYSRHPQPEEDVQIANLLNDDYAFKGHGVHTYEHLRALTIAAFHGKDQKYTKALSAYLDRLENVTTDSGGPIGDEWIAGRHAHHSETGYEYCSLQELLNSYAVLLQKTGDSKWADKIEWILYNAGQGARHPNGKSIAYCKTDNSYDVLGHLDMQNPQGEMRFKYSPAHQDVAVCCAPNAGRIYPYFMQNMWQFTDNGIVANLYGPSVMQTTINGVEVKIEQVTEYPFRHAIKFVVNSANPVNFTLSFRRPAWAQQVLLNGTESLGSGDYIHINKFWKGQTELSVNFDDQVEIVKRGETAGVHYGPLLYALPIEYVASTGRVYPVDGFDDLFFKGKDLADEAYQLSMNAQFKRFAEIQQASWINPPILKGQLYDPKSEQEVAVELIPMGSTILRKVSFDIAPTSK